MELYGVGNMILYYREKNGLTQRQLCRGICTEATICRIETGCREFDSLISETLLGRLGKTADRLEFILNDDDYMLNELRDDILAAIRNGDTGLAERLLKKYEGDMPVKEKLHRQFVLFAKGLLAETAGKTEAAAAEFEKALALTCPDEEKKSLEMLLYSPMEAELICRLFYLRRRETDRLFRVLAFMERMYDAEAKQRYMVPALEKALERFEEEQDWAAAEGTCEKAIAILDWGKSYEHLTRFYWGRMKARQKRRGKAGTPEEKQELIRQCRTLYYMGMIEENSGLMEEIEEFSRKLCGITEWRNRCPITEWEI